MPNQKYPAAEKFILSREFFGMKLGLDNIREFLELLGNPQYKFKTIHISGTNGKGSTASMLAAVLQEQGYKTGLFTSPHLNTLRERVKVNNRKIPKPSVTAFIRRNIKELSRRKISFFELITAMALDHFSRVKVDIAVIETGLGGRLDATNVLNPILTMTTGISRDHIEILGHSISKIAYEKAGIIKPKVPHLIGEVIPSAKTVFEKRCQKIDSPLICLENKNYSVHDNKRSFDFHDNGFSIKKITPSLIGSHQLKNSALALKALGHLNKSGLKITKQAARRGIEETVWPGRFQLVKYSRKPDHIFDVSHNVDGINAFVESFKNIYHSQKARIITGFVKRKEHIKIFNSLGKIASDFAIVPLNTKRGTDLDEMINQIDFKAIPYRKYGSLSSAYKSLMKTSQPDDIIIIIGSHFLVGEFFEKHKL